MKVKNRNLIELILQVLTLVLAFIPSFYNCEKWRDGLEYAPNLDMYIPIEKLDYRYSCSLFDSIFNTDGIIMIFGMILLATFALGTILYTLQFIAKDEKRNWKPTIIISIIEIVFFAICSLLIETNDWSHSDYEFRYSLQILFFVMLFVLAALIVISIFGYIKASKNGIIEETPKIYKAEIVKETSQADELKKYKDLLDSGIITQEEFDAKKKQLLGL